MSIIWTLHALQQIAPNAKLSIIEPLCQWLEAAFKAANITKPLEQAHFIAQIAHESAGFRTLVEYGGRRYFKKYDGRMGNGAGEGYEYRGRGLIQLTGKNNYVRQGYEHNPDDVAKFPAALDVSIKFWLDNRLREYALKDDIKRVTRKINGGYNGLDDRRNYLKRAKRCLRSGNTDWIRANLAKLGYDNPRQFQRENGLVVDGDIGTLSRAKMQEMLKAREKRKSKTNLKTGLGIGAAAEVLRGAADQIEPLTYALPMLQYVFIAVTLAGVGLVIWSMIKKQVAPDEVSA